MAKAWIWFFTTDGPELELDFRGLFDCATICIRQIMSENANLSVPSPTLALGKWLGLVVAAVVLAEGISSTLVSLTKSLLLPLMARAIGGDGQSPLGKGDFNVPDLFTSVVELCLAGIVFLSIKIWVSRGTIGVPRVRRVAAPSRVPLQIVPPTAAAAPETAPAPMVPVPPPVISQAPVSPPVVSQVPVPPPKPSSPPIPPPAPAKAKKAEKPKEVYYNIVGEPITPEEDD